MTLDPSKIHNIKDLAAYIAENAKYICVKTEEGRVAFLSDLPGDQAVKYAMEFVRENKLPRVAVQPAQDA